MICLLPVLAAAVLLAACGDDDDSTAGTSPEGVDVSTEPSPGELPDTFPGAFPVYSGATLTRAGDFGGRFIAEWRAIAATADVADFYLGALAASPWSIQIESEEGGVTLIEFVGDEETARFVGDVAIAPIQGTEQTRVLLNLVAY